MTDVKDLKFDNEETIHQWLINMQVAGFTGKFIAKSKCGQHIFVGELTNDGVIKRRLANAVESRQFIRDTYNGNKKL